MIRIEFLLQRIKTSIITSSSWGPGQLANQEPGNELPDYVICTPDNHKPENALAILTANLFIPNLTNLITAQVRKRSEFKKKGIKNGWEIDRKCTLLPKINFVYKVQWTWWKITQEWVFISNFELVYIHCMICCKFDIGCSLHRSLNQYLNLLKYH